jgi:RNA 3'-terminal phosphate cyclase
MAQWSTIGNEVDGTAISMTLATCRYTHTSTAIGEEGFSPEQRTFQRWRSTSKWSNGSMVDENLRAQLLSCISTPQVLGARKRNLPVMKSEGKSSHR